MTELNIHSKYIDKRISDIKKKVIVVIKTRKNWAFEMRKVYII